MTRHSPGGGERHLRAAFASIALFLLAEAARAEPAPPPAAPPPPSFPGETTASDRLPLLPPLALAQLSPPQPLSHPFTRNEAITLGIFSAFFGVGTIGVNNLPSPTLAGLAPHTYYSYGTATLAAVPIAFVSPLDALEVGTWTLALSTADLGLRYDGARRTSSNLNPYWNVTETFVLHHGLYAPYAAYRDARVAGSSEAWDDAWRPYTADEIVFAPLHWSNLNHPIVWAGVSADAAVTGIVAGVGLATKTSVVAPASKIVQSIGLGTLTSWDAGTTEDPLFRGFFYEELQLALGRWPARAIDMSLFTLSHVPGEIGQGPAVILGGLADRAASGLLFEMAYDQGGLLESVAFHVLWDTVDNLVTSFFESTPATRRGLSRGLIPNLPPSSITLGNPLAAPVHQAFSLSLPL